MMTSKTLSNRARAAHEVCHVQEPNRAAVVLSARCVGDSVDHAFDQRSETTVGTDRGGFLARRAEHSQDRRGTSGLRETRMLTTVEHRIFASVLVSLVTGATGLNLNAFFSDDLVLALGD